MDRDVIRRRIDGVVAYLVEHSDTIVRAATDLGVPLEDAMCCCVRQAVNRRVIDDRQQLLINPAEGDA